MIRQVTGKMRVAPRQSLRRGRQKSYPPQGSGFQKSEAYPDTLSSEFTPAHTLAWQARSLKRRLEKELELTQDYMTALNMVHPTPYTSHPTPYTLRLTLYPIHHTTQERTEAPKMIKSLPRIHGGFLRVSIRT